VIVERVHLAEGGAHLADAQLKTAGQGREGHVAFL
jgi:hypothetical protein